MSASSIPAGYVIDPAAVRELHEHAVRVEDLPALVAGDSVRWYVNGAQGWGEPMPLWGYLVAAEPGATSPAHSVPGVGVTLTRKAEPEQPGYRHIFGTSAPAVRNVDGVAVVDAAPARVILSHTFEPGELCTVCGATVGLVPVEGVQS